MDLLRLVLSRQPIEVLRSRFERLLRSSEFILIRSGVINGTRRGFSWSEYLEFCTKQGELCHISVIWETKEALTSRCVFLRDVENYLYFATTSNNYIDVCYGLSSGIRKIQAMAMAHYGTGHCVAIGSLRVPWTIPWTPALRERVKTYMKKNNELGGRSSLLLGYLDDEWKSKTFEQVKGFLYSRTKNRSIVTRDPVAEDYLEKYCFMSVQKYLKGEKGSLNLTPVLIESGYLYPVIEMLEGAKPMIMDHHKVTAITFIRIPLIKRYDYNLASIQLPIRNYTAEDVLMAQEALTDPEVMGKISQYPNVVTLYQQLASDGPSHHLGMGICSSQEILSHNLDDCGDFATEVLSLQFARGRLRTDVPPDRIPATPEVLQFLKETGRINFLNKKWLYPLDNKMFEAALKLHPNLDTGDYDEEDIKTEQKLLREAYKEALKMLRQ